MDELREELQQYRDMLESAYTEQEIIRSVFENNPGLCSGNHYLHKLKEYWLDVGETVNIPDLIEQTDALLDAIDSLCEEDQ
jgi:hypothetical protein